MKRDMDLIRKILMTIHDDEHGYQVGQVSIDGYDEETVGYHCYLLHQAGLIEAADVSHEMHGSPHALPLNLTWEGHEFIENAYNEVVWKETKGVISKLGNVSFSIWSSVLSKIVMQNLGIDN